MNEFIDWAEYQGADPADYEDRMIERLDVDVDLPPHLWDELS